MVKKKPRGRSVITVGELREMLEPMEEDWEVRLAHQPTWPLAHFIKGVVERPQDTDELSEAEQEEIENGSVEQTGIVWIVATEGNCSDHPYAPKSLWDEC